MIPLTSLATAGKKQILHKRVLVDWRVADSGRGMCMVAYCSSLTLWPLRQPKLVVQARDLVFIGQHLALDVSSVTGSLIRFAAKSLSPCEGSDHLPENILPHEYLTLSIADIRVGQEKRTGSRTIRIYKKGEYDEETVFQVLPETWDELRQSLSDFLLAFGLPYKEISALRERTRLMLMAAGIRRSTFS